MIIIRYDTSLPLKDTYDRYMQIRAINPNEGIIFVPKDWEVLQDCSIDQLKGFRDMFDKLILEREVNNES